MKKLNIWFKVFLITLILIIPISLLILFKERVRKNLIIDQDLTYYNSLQNDLNKFKNDQLAYSADQINKNKLDMQTAKLTYDYLLSQQADIVKSHSYSKTVVTNPSTSSGTNSQTVNKPTSTRKTKTS